MSKTIKTRITLLIIICLSVFLLASCGASPIEDKPNEKEKEYEWSNLELSSNEIKYLESYKQAFVGTYVNEGKVVVKCNNGDVVYKSGNSIEIARVNEHKFYNCSFSSYTYDLYNYGTSKLDEFYMRLAKMTKIFTYDIEVDDSDIANDYYSACKKMGYVIQDEHNTIITDETTFVCKKYTSYVKEIDNFMFMSSYMNYYHEDALYRGVPSILSAVSSFISSYTISRNMMTKHGHHEYIDDKLTVNFDCSYNDACVLINLLPIFEIQGESDIHSEEQTIKFEGKFPICKLAVQDSFYYAYDKYTIEYKNNVLSLKIEYAGPFVIDGGTNAGEYYFASTGFIAYKNKQENIIVPQLEEYNNYIKELNK